MSNWLKNSFIYLLCAGISGLLAFAFLPFLSHYLSPEDYGQIALIMLYVKVLQPLLHYGSINLAQIFYHEKSPGEAWGFLKGSSKFLFVLPLLLILVQVIIPEFIDRYFHIKPMGFYLTIVLTLLTVIGENLFAMLIISGRSKAYAYSFLSKTFVDYGISIFLIASIGMAWEGRILGSIIAMLIPAMYYAKNLLGTKSTGKQGFIDLLSIGSPFIVYEISRVVLNMSDRWFLEEMTNGFSNGIYSMAYTFSSVFLLFSLPLLQGSKERIFKSLAERNFKVFIRLNLYLILTLLFALLVLALISKPLFEVLIDGSYHEAMHAIPWILGGLFFWSLFQLSYNLISFFRMKTILILVSIGALIFNLVSNYLLIRTYSWMGAAYASFISYALLFMVGILISYFYLKREIRSGK